MLHIMLFFLYIKKKSYSQKLRYEGNIEIICRCLCDDMYIELTRIRISYGEITCVNGKAYILIV